MERKNIKINEEIISYIESGEENSKNLVLFHGNMSSSLVFTDIIKKLDKDYHIYAPDFRSFGESTYNNKISSVKDIAVDMILLLKKLEIKRTYVLGWSLGGGVLMELMGLDYDNIVEKAIFLSSISPLGMDRSYDNAISIFNANIEISRQILNLNPLYKVFFNEDMVKNNALSILFKESIFNVKMPEISVFNKMIESAGKQRSICEIGNILKEFKFNKIIRKPILIIHGEDDIVVRKEDAEESNKFFGKWSTLKIYENCGHCPIIDKEDILTHDIKEFFEI